MATRTRDLSIAVRMKERAAKTLKKVTRDIAYFKRKALRSFRSIKKAVFSLRGAFLGLGLALGARAVLGAYHRQEKAIASMESSMKSMGRYTPELSKGLQDLADHIQEVGVSGNEMVLEGQSMLVTFREISDDLLPKATKVMANLAAKMGGDVTRAATMVGKAAMGMSGELRKAGITIDEATAKSGDFSKILDAIQEQVGNQQEDLRRTGYGGMEAMKNAFGEVEKAAGKSLSLGLKPFVEYLLNNMPEVKAKLDETLNEQTAKNFSIAIAAVADAGKLLVQVFKALGLAGNAAFLVINAAMLITTKTLAAILGIIDKIPTAFSPFKVALKAVGLDVGDLKDELLKAVDAGVTLGKDAKENIALLRKDMGEFKWGEWQEKVTRFWEAAADKERAKAAADALKKLNKEAEKTGMILGGALAALDAHKESMKEFGTDPTPSVPKQKGLNEELKKQLEHEKKILAVKKQYRDVLVNNVLGALDSAVEGTFEWRRALRGLIKDLMMVAARMVVTKVAGAAMGTTSFARGGIQRGTFKSMSRIPHYGAGAEVAANDPHLAVVGDNPTREEVIFTRKRGHGIEAVVAGDGGSTIVQHIHIHAIDSRGVHEALMEGGVLRNAFKQLQTENPDDLVPGFAGA